MNSLKMHWSQFLIYLHGSVQSPHKPFQLYVHYYRQRQHAIYEMNTIKQFGTYYIVSSSLNYVFPRDKGLLISGNSARHLFRLISAF
jgi:hypothetical protein